MKKIWVISAFAFGVVFFAPRVFAAGESGGGFTPLALVGLAIILFLAKVAGEICERLKQPPVLGELFVGILLGTLILSGVHSLEFLKTDSVISSLAQLGIIIMLFEIGLETDLQEMRTIGVTAFVVAIVGMAMPMLFGYFVAGYFFPTLSLWGKIFIGATLAGTSIGITARVLKDIKKVDTKEAKIILGAAVLDDVVGLLLMSVIASAVAATTLGQSISLTAIVIILIKAVAFLFGAFLFGHFAMPMIFKALERFRSKGAMFIFSAALCFFLAWLAAVVELAPIIGAFAAGLILEEAHFEYLPDHTKDELIDLLRPLSALFAPIFFVSVGLKVDISAFTNPQLIGFAICLLLAAVVGKLFCSVAAFERGLNRIAIGIGMAPRGELTLVFAGLGMTLMLPNTNGVLEPVISPATFGVYVFIAMVTAFLTPPALKWALSRKT